VIKYKGASKIAKLTPVPREVRKLSADQVIVEEEVTLKRDYNGCWECSDFETCDKFNFLKPAHGDANIKNLRKIQKKGVDVFLAGKKNW
jgi:hypothetical protein